MTTEKQLEAALDYVIRHGNHEIRSIAHRIRSKAFLATDLGYRRFLMVRGLERLSGRSMAMDVRARVVDALKEER